MKKAKVIDIVCFSDIFWDAVWQRHQNILTRFPNDWKILFIEPTSLIILLREPRRFFSRHLDNITIVSLPTLPLIDKVKSLRFVNDSIVLCWLRFIFMLEKIRSPTLLYYEPRFSSLIGRLGERMVAYDCVDDKMTFSKVPPWIKIYMEHLIYKANVIFVTSDRLYQKMCSYGAENVYLVGNGVDVDHFTKAMSDVVPIPDDIKELSSPIIGYFGVIDEWMDINLVIEIASAYPTASILLIGPVLLKPHESLYELKKCRNVFLIGKKPYDVLPYYLKAFNVCIIPFKINELTKSVNPIKLYEYMAGGKNIVSTALPELEKYRDTVNIAIDSKDFIRKIDIAMAKKPDIEILNTIIRENTWDNKVAVIIDTLRDK